MALKRHEAESLCVFDDEVVGDVFIVEMGAKAALGDASTPSYTGSFSSSCDSIVSQGVPAFDEVVEIVGRGFDEFHRRFSGADRSMSPVESVSGCPDGSRIGIVLRDGELVRGGNES